MVHACESTTRAKQAVQEARRSIANAVEASPEEVIFTSGATESNNLALLGLSDFGVKSGRRHIVSTSIEHKAILEPLEVLGSRGFSVTHVSPDTTGKVSPGQILAAVRSDTLLVSVMQANNETGVVQPISEISSLLSASEAFFHVDAAQGFGKELDSLKNSRIDLISISGHKIYAPKGIGALVARRRGFERPPLTPLVFGGGQERGLRAGTLPVPLIAGFGLASDLAIREYASRRRACLMFKHALISHLGPLGAVFHGNLDEVLHNTLNLHFPGVDSEALMLALKEFVALSNGSACTSQSYKPSHVLEAMGLSPEAVKGAVRFSWYHDTPELDWTGIEGALRGLI